MIRSSARCSRPSSGHRRRSLMVLRSRGPVGDRGICRVSGPLHGTSGHPANHESPLVVSHPRRNQKWALKRIARQFLPHSIVYRKKLPWDLPLQRYIAHYAQPGFFSDGFCLEALGLHPKALEEMTRFYDRLLPSFFNLVNLESGVASFSCMSLPNRSRSEPLARLQRQRFDMTWRALSSSADSVQ